MTGLLLACVLALTGCGDSDLTGPGALDAFGRTVIEEVAADRLTDLRWAARTHGGDFPQLSYAFSLAGVEAGVLASVTVDPSLEPGVKDPYCSSSLVDGLLECARAKLREDRDWVIEVYVTAPPDSTPATGSTISYRGVDPDATVVYRPPPLRAWTFEASRDGAVSAVSAGLDERFALLTPSGDTVEVVVRGRLEAELESPAAIRAELSVVGMSACSELRISYRSIHGRDRDGGEIRCGERIWAEIVVPPGEPVEVRWRG